MRFVKMHGIGNDYVYINGFAETVRAPQQLAHQLSDRHFGVGGDGMVLVLPPEPGVEAHVRMRMFNADGSESEMCGNAIRCVCKLAYDHQLTPGIHQAQPMRIQTGRGVLTLAYQVGADGKVSQATVDMGRPILKPMDIPVRLSDLAQVVNHPIAGLFHWPEHTAGWMEKAGLDARMTCVSMGNPHAVFFCRSLQEVPLEHVGPVIENHALFPRRINAHFVQVAGPAEINMRTWERGTGITLACGTGACAAAVAAVLTGRTERRMQAHLPGGDLQLEWMPDAAGDLGTVLLTGTATEVFTGEWRGNG